MAKKKYQAVHRIMTKAKPPTYIEPGTAFMMEEKDGDRLTALGAAKAAEEQIRAAEKKAAAPKKAAAKADEPEAGDDDDLV